MENILDLIKVSKKDLGKSDMTSGNKYLVTMAYMSKQICFEFNDNYQNKSDKKDFLYALMSDSQAYSSCRDIKGFCDLYGYGNENAKDVINTFNGCREQFEKYNKLFNKQEQAEIENLLADY